MEKMEADLIVFDLDGTLIDSKRDIAWSVNRMLAVMGLSAIPEETIYGYVGNGVRPLIERAIAAAGKEDALDVAIKHFQDLYIAHLLDTTVMFDGVREVLEHFHPGKKMAVASNKPVRYVLKILEGLGMARYFVSVKGGDSVEAKKPAPEMLVEIMNESAVRAERTLFVGDSGVDIRTGKNAGVRTVGAAYGFRPVEEIVAGSPDAIIRSPLELKDIIR